LTTDADALVVPATAVQASQEGQYVYVVKPDQTVEMRNVTIERQQSDMMVIAQGLTVGEEVVTDGQLRLTPGAHITRGRGKSGAPGAPGAHGNGPRGDGSGDPGKSRGGRDTGH
jgi:membrane fusion protein, multidrug efflux system